MTYYQQHDGVRIEDSNRKVLLGIAESQSFLETQREVTSMYQEIESFDLESHLPASRSTLPSTQDKGFYLLLTCQLLRYSTAVVLAIILITQCIGLIHNMHNLQSMTDFYSLLFEVYGVLFIVIALFCELEFTEVIRTTTLLQYWSTRGLFYIFIGLFVLQSHNHLTLVKIWSLRLATIYLVQLLLMMGMMYVLLVRSIAFVNHKVYC